MPGNGKSVTGLDRCIFWKSGRSAVRLRVHDRPAPRKPFAVFQGGFLLGEQFSNLDSLPESGSRHGCDLPVEGVDLGGEVEGFRSRSIPRVGPVGVLGCRRARQGQSAVRTCSIGTFLLGFPRRQSKRFRERAPHGFGGSLSFCDIGMLSLQRLQAPVEPVEFGSANYNHRQNSRLVPVANCSRAPSESLGKL